MGARGRLRIRTPAARLGLAAVTLLALAVPVRAAIIRAATITRQDHAIELHFALTGGGFHWNLSRHGEQLWIDFDHGRIELPREPLRGQTVPPVATVTVIDSGGDTGRIVIEVAGQADYAIGTLPHELVVRFAVSGATSDVGAPLLVAMDRARASRPTRPLRTVTTTTRTVRWVDQPESAAPTPPASPVPTRRQVAAPVAAVTRTARPRPPAGERLAAIEVTPPQSSGYSRTKESASRRGSPGEAPLVVIDPGHGGHDPGTEAAAFVTEKQVALAIALRLRDALVARGVRVRMTRTDDRFLSLAARNAIANQAGADLFISIHLNSSPDPQTSGIETYYLNNTTDRATIRLARMENDVAGGYGTRTPPNLHYILTDMRQQDKAIESAALARMIEADAVADVDASGRTHLNDLGAKQGPFYVLVGALMPAVLVECGFLSNAVEAQLLDSPTYQAALADGIANAVVHYLTADASVGNL